MSNQSFADLGISPAVRNALAKQGITEPFAVQKLVIGDALAGHDVLVKSPTGSGKTLAFSAPIVERLEADERRPARRSSSPPRASSRSRSPKTSGRSPRARNLSVAAVYGGAGIESRRSSPAARRSSSPPRDACST